MGPRQYFSFVDHVFGRTINEGNHQNLYVAKACRFVLCKALRSVCYKNGKEKDKLQGAAILHELGRVQQLIGDCYHSIQRVPRLKNLDKVAFIRGAVLLNAAMARKPGNREIENDLHKLCAHVLELAHANNKKAELVTEAKVIFQKVVKMRATVTTSLAQIPLIKKGDNTETKLDHANKIEALQNQLTQQYISIMNDIMEYCISAMGPAPCRYALAGMGSLSRKEITPQSDFENITILEDGAQFQSNYEDILDYFRWASTLFQVMLVNFGETIVRFMAVPGLNWFYDAHTPCGICPDGYAWKANKNSLGRQEYTAAMPWKVELIKPVGLMLDYLQPNEDRKNGCHLADMLRTTCFVSGDEEVHREFQQAALKTRPEVLNQQHIDEIKQVVLEFNSFYGILFEEWKLQMDIKRIVYRGTTSFLAVLGRHYHIDSPSCFDIVRSLHDILPSIQSHLVCAVATACETRLRVYAGSEHQDDMVEYYVMSKGLSGLNKPHGKVMMRMVDVIGTEALMWYFKCAFYLQLKVVKLGDYKIDDPLFDVTFKTLAEREELFDSKKMDVFLHSFIGLHSDVIQEYESSTNTEESILPELVARSYMVLMKTRSAIQYIQNVLGQVNEKETIRVSILNMYMTLCCMKEENYADGLQRCNKAESAIMQSFERSEPTDLVKNGLLYIVSYLKGVCHFYLGNYADAEKHLTNAQSLQSPDKLSVHVRKAEEYAALARCKFYLGDMQGCADLLQRELHERQVASHSEEVDPDLATCYASLGTVALSQGDVQKGMHQYKIAQRIFHTNGDPMWQKKAAFLELSQLWLKMTHNQNHNLQDLLQLNESLDSALQRFDGNSSFTSAQGQQSEGMDTMFKYLSSGIALSQPNEQGADNVSLVIQSGEAQMNQGQFVNALVNFRTAQILWRMFEVPLEKRSNAKCFRLIGECMQQLSLYQEALKHFQDELKCIEVENFNKDHDSEKAQCLNAIARCFAVLGDQQHASKYFQLADETIEKHQEIESILEQANEAKRKGRSCLNSQHFEQALHYYEQELHFLETLIGEKSAQDRIAESLFWRALCFFKLSDFHSALDFLHQAKSIWESEGNDNFVKKFAKCQKWLGKCQYELGNVQEAFTSFQMELEQRKRDNANADKDPDIALSYFNLALCYMKCFDTNEAASYFYIAKMTWEANGQEKFRQNIKDCDSYISQLQT